jgi:hypothetical protein
LGFWGVTGGEAHEVIRRRISSTLRDKPESGFRLLDNGVGLYDIYDTRAIPCWELASERVAGGDESRGRGGAYRHTQTSNLSPKTYIYFSSPGARPIIRSEKEKEKKR